MQRHLQNPQGVSVLAEILLPYSGAQALSQLQDAFKTETRVGFVGAEG